MQVQGLYQRLSLFRPLTQTVNCVMSRTQLQLWKVHYPPGGPEARAGLRPRSGGRPLSVSLLLDGLCAFALHLCGGLWSDGLSSLLQTQQPAAGLPQPASRLLIQGLGGRFLFGHHVVVPSRHPFYLLGHCQVDAGLGPQLRALYQHGEKGTCGASGEAGGEGADLNSAGTPCFKTLSLKPLEFHNVLHHLNNKHGPPGERFFITFECMY